jgi:hypothetical protein
MYPMASSGRTSARTILTNDARSGGVPEGPARHAVEAARNMLSHFIEGTREDLGYRISDGDFGNSDAVWKG